jgi:adenosine deaminase
MPPARLDPDLWRALPKAELHVHLEGTVDLATLEELVREGDPPLLAQGGFVESMRSDLATPMREALARVRAGDDPRSVRDFNTFVDAFRLGLFSLRHGRDYGLLLERHLARVHAQGVVYTEVMFSPAVLPQPYDTILRAEEALDAMAGVIESWRGRVDCALIVDLTRNMGPERALLQLKEAIAGRDRGVVAVGLGGEERDWPATLFARHFEVAREAGLRVTCHAGETLGPQSVREALAVGAERIGHGVRAVEDPDLIAELVERAVPLEISPTSNVVIGVTPALELHVLPALLNAGVEVNISTDDPGVFACDLEGEYALLRDTFELDMLTELRLVENSFRHAFLPAERREAYLGSLESALREMAPA